MNVARAASTDLPSSSRRARSRSAPSTACTSATGACSTPRSRPGGRRRSSPSTRTRARRSATASSCWRPLERRLELLAEAGVEETLVVEFDLELAQLDAGGLRRARPAADRHRGRRRRRELPLRPRPRAAISRCSRASVSTFGPCRSSRASPRRGSATCCGAVRSSGRRSCSGARPRSTASSSSGDARGGTLGFPTANLAVEPGAARARLRDLRGRCRRPARGDLDRHEPALRRRRAANRGVPARLRRATSTASASCVELWQRLRDEQAFDSEAELVAQIDRDVEATRRAQRPA